MLSQIMSGHSPELNTPHGRFDCNKFPVLESRRVYPGGQVLPVGLRGREHSQYGCYSVVLL